MWRASRTRSGHRRGGGGLVPPRPGHPRAPSQIISYVSAHDNLTLWDKLLAVRYKKPDYSAAPDTILAQNRLAAGIYLTCMGTPFMQAGEEFARTKKGIKDSYRSPASINQLDWGRAARFHGLVDYYRGLIRPARPLPPPRRRQAGERPCHPVLSLEPPLEGWHLKPPRGTAPPGPKSRSFTTPPPNRARAPARRPMASAVRRRLLQPVARRGDHPHRLHRASALQRHHFGTSIKPFRVDQFLRAVARQKFFPPNIPLLDKIQRRPRTSAWRPRTLSAPNFPVCVTTVRTCRPVVTFLLPPKLEYTN